MNREETISRLLARNLVNSIYIPISPNMGVEEREKADELKM